jgi:hypothetical protein
MEYVEGFASYSKEPIICRHTYYCIASGNEHFIFTIGFTRNLEDEGYKGEEDKFLNNVVSKSGDSYIAHFTIRPKHGDTSASFTARASAHAKSLIKKSIATAEYNKGLELIKNNSKMYVIGYVKEGRLVDAVLHTYSTVEGKKDLYLNNKVVHEPYQIKVYFVISSGTPMTKLEEKALQAISNSER